MNKSNLHLNFYGIRVFAENFSNFSNFKSNCYQRKVNSENKKSNKKKPVLRISNMEGTGISSTLIIDRERGPMSAENVEVADSPDSGNTILKNLRLANVNRLICL